MHERIKIQIDSIAFGGRGVGRKEDGKVVFVAGAIPGETVYAEIIKEHKNYILAEIDEVLVASPARVKPFCHLFSLCGGCDWQYIAYQRQVEYKQDILLRQVMHKCPLKETLVGERVPSPAESGYRCHAILRCSSENGFVMGFYQKSTNAIVPHEKCPILNEQTRSTLHTIREILKRSPVPGILSLEVHALDEILVRAVCSRKPRLKDMEIFKEIYLEAGLAGFSSYPAGDPGSEYILGESSFQHKLMVKGNSIRLSIGFGGFVQVNAEVNEVMVNHVAELAMHSERILDLYCGSGNISLPLALESSEIVGIEKDPGLVRSGIANAESNRLEKVKFLAMDAEEAVLSLSKKGEAFDTIILDPPREGAKNVVGNLARLNPDRIIYISCDPSTLSRDLAILMQNGFRLKRIRLFDMFPQTYHLESVSYLER